MDDSSVNIDQQLLKAYLNAKYYIVKPSLNIEVGAVSRPLDVFLMDNNAYNWAFVSAWNPQSVLLGHLENEGRHQALMQNLIEARYTFCEGYGESNDGSWPAEKSLLILDIPRIDAMRLGRRYQQNAILYGMLNKPAELVWLEGLSN